MQLARAEVSDENVIPYYHKYNTIIPLQGKTPDKANQMQHLHVLLYHKFNYRLSLTVYPDINGIHKDLLLSA